MSGWHCRKEGLLNDYMEGPFSDDALLQLCFDGKLSAKTLVAHPVKTKAQWVPLERFPAAIKRMDDGVQSRQAQKAADHERKQAEAEQRHQAKEQQRQAAISDAAAHHAALPFAKFLTDGQSESAVAKIYDRVQRILTSQETIEYIAVQSKPIAIAPDCAVLTNRRFIVFRQKMLGQADFDDYLWRELFDARVKEGILYAALSFRASDGKTIFIDYLPKSQAMKIYRISQEQEEAAVEERRQRAMEEKRAGASNLVVNASPLAAQAPVAAAVAEDPVAKLQKLKSMLDADLISADEYNAAKARILQSM